jgi:hypothetical protein
MWVIILLLLQHPLASCSSFKFTILRASLAKFTGTCQTFQSPESPKHTFSHTKRSLQPDGLSHHIWRVLTLVSGITLPFERINHAQSGMIYQASHQGLQHPLKWKYLFPSVTVIIWVFQCDHELTTLPRVYSSWSCVCPLFHSRNHALHLRESPALSSKSPGSSPPLTMGQPIKGWSISVFILWVLQCHSQAHYLDKSQLVPGTCAYPLLIPNSCVLMLHKSSTYLSKENVI